MNAFAFIKTHPWAYPGLEVVHLIGIALLLGNLLLLEARAWGAGASIDLAALSALSLKLVLTGFGLAVLSGLLMFASQPLELIANRAFTIKMGLITLAGCNAAWFHGRGGFARLDGMGKSILLASGLIWIAVLACGRWIGYL